MVRMGPTIGPFMGPRMGPNPSFTLSIRIVAHGLPAGSGPFTLTTTGVLPAPLAVLTDYYAIPVDADHLQLAASRADALAGTAITLTDAGTGVHTLVTVAATEAPTSLTFSETFTGNAGDEVAVFGAAHGLGRSDGPFRATTTDTLPTPLLVATDYWLRDFGDGVSAFVYPSFALAAAGAAGWEAIADNGIGTHTLTAQPGAEHYEPIALIDSTFTVA